MDMTPSDPVSVSYADKDPFLKEFYARIPKDLANSFSEGQLMGLRMAYGARSRGAHAVDIRPSFNFFGRRFYMVMLIGAERRSPNRKIFGTQHPFWTWANAVFLSISIFILVFALLGLLYMAKISAGINVFPGVDVLPDEEIQAFLRFLFDW